MPPIARRRHRPAAGAPAAPRVGSLSVASPTLDALVAAAVQVPVSKGTGAASATGAAGLGSDWKAQAWAYYDTVGELRYVCQWLSNALSRCQLIPSELDPKTNVPTGTTENAAALELARDIAGGPAGQAALLSRLATYLTVPGEGYVVVIDVPEVGEDGELTGASIEEWHVISDQEIKRTGTTTKVVLGDREVEVTDDNATFVRVYRPHPRNARESDSPVRAALPILREIVRLGQHVEATAKSRLAGAGMLLLPQELSMPVPATDDPNDASLAMRPVTVSQVMTQLQAAMSTAVGEPDSAAAIVPLMLQAPGQWLDKVQRLSFASEFTKVVMELRDSAIKRLSLALDVPAEVLMGMGGVNHWGSWQIEESAIKLHVEPLLVIVCDLLTEGVYRPMLERGGMTPDEAALHHLWFNVDGLALKPNRSADAALLHAAGVISDAAYRQACGFTDGDAPVLDEEAGRRELLQKILVGAPSLFPQIAPLLGLASPEEAAPVETVPAAGSAAAAPDTAPAEGPPDTAPAGSGS